MAQQYLSELRVFGFGFPPKGWALCNGQLLAINQNQALFALIGTTYGGNGTTNFQLPNFQGRTMLGVGKSPISGAQYVWGEIGGVENVTLLPTQMPNHTHLVAAQTVAANSTVAATAKIAVVKNTVTTTDVINVYATGVAPNVALEPRTIGSAGNNTPHTNMPPFLVMNICIATTGLFPSRN